MSFGGPENNTTLEDALIYGHNHGVIMVASVGNNLTEVYYPASSEYTTAVSATDNEDVVWIDEAIGSNFGEEVDIAAPGVRIVSTIPGEQYVYATGTSMATPHISGVVSLIWSVNPLLTPDQVKQVLFTTAVDISDPGIDIYTGHGRVDAYAALSTALVNLPDKHKLYFPLIQVEYTNAHKVYFPFIISNVY
jgi:subtilisin family serine protease